MAVTFPQSSTLNGPLNGRQHSESFEQAIVRLQSVRDQVVRSGGPSASVAIFGAGPAGLTRAIACLLNGNPVSVFEKRAEGANGRDNTVALKGQAIAVLKEYAVYPYLLEKGWIFPETKGELNVRLGDLEEAMKAVIGRLSSNPIIQYGTVLEKIENSSGRANLVLKTSSPLGRSHQTDLIVVAEGAHSSTQALLGHRRISVLPPVPVLAAIYKDDRPDVTGVVTLCQYVGKTLANQVVCIYYHTLFIFKCCFQGEHIFNPNRKIAGSLVLKTPNQYYLGSGLSRSESEVLLDLIKRRREAKEALLSASSLQEKQELEKRAQAVEKEWRAFTSYWSALSVCFSNVLSVFAYFYGQKREIAWNWFPLDHVNAVEIGADKSSAYGGRIGNTPYLLAGDSLATVDPTTGLGCRSAIEMVDAFRTFLEGMSQRAPQVDLIESYRDRCAGMIAFNHGVSQQMRAIYRPDRL